MVRNAAIDFLRKEQRKKASHAEIGRLQEKESENFAFQQVAHAELLQQLSTAMDSLPSGCNKVVSMFYLEGKELQAIADEMDISVHTVKSQKARGLQLLRKKITRSIGLFFFTPLYILLTPSIVLLTAGTF
jgi:RNA polymerase sigma-70 factor (ECF subfamily)